MFDLCYKNPSLDFPPCLEASVSSHKLTLKFCMAETQTFLREASNALMPEMLEHR